MDAFVMKVLQSDSTDISTLLVLFYVKVRQIKTRRLKLTDKQDEVLHDEIQATQRNNHWHST